MSDLAFDARPFAEHIPDSGAPEGHRDPGSVEQGAGMIELGFYIGEHRVVLTSLKAGAFTDLFENGDPTTGKASEGASSSSSSSTSSSQPATPSDATTERIAELEQRLARLEQPTPADGEHGDTSGQ